MFQLSSNGRSKPSLGTLSGKVLPDLVEIWADARVEAKPC
jgi:hypothetical protein